MNSKINDGVGKKIVEALKKQSQEDIVESFEASSAFDGLIPNVEDAVSPLNDIPAVEEFVDNNNEELLSLETPEQIISEQVEDVTVIENDASELLSAFDSIDEEPVMIDEVELTNAPVIEEAPISKLADDFIQNNSFNDINVDGFISEEPQMSAINTFIPEVTEVDMPSNILILKKLISQLPSGVTRHTGAQIIKQTMEALGISMKSVLKEAQDVQDNLKASGRECQATIQEYRKQIANLEKKSQSYQKQYGALNDLISLFIQTTK